MVAASCDPRTTFLKLVAPSHLDVGTDRQAGNIRARGAIAKVHLALQGRFEVSSRPGERIAHIQCGGGHVDDLERAYDALKYGRVSDPLHLDVFVPSVDRPALAPEGHEVLSILASYVPGEVEGGWNDEARSRLIESVLQRLEAVCPDVRDRVVAHQLFTPADLATEFGLWGGHLYHGEHALDQLFWMRPAPCAASYATPIPGLYLCGSGSHPGGGITGIPGSLGADAILHAG